MSELIILIHFYSRYYFTKKTVRVVFTFMKSSSERWWAADFVLNHTHINHIHKDWYMRIIIKTMGLYIISVNIQIT
jgi:hypothetical protein